MKFTCFPVGLAGRGRSVKYLSTPGPPNSEIRIPRITDIFLQSRINNTSRLKQDFWEQARRVVHYADKLSLDENIRIIIHRDLKAKTTKVSLDSF